MISNIYIDPAIDREVVTNSSLKTFRRCPRLYLYKYVERLKVRTLSRPLQFGSWMHELLEVHHKGEDWTTRHQQLTLEYDKLMDEEKDHYGDLPTDCAALMRSYVWYYRDDPWKVLETEFTLDYELPNGVVYRGRVDALVETQFGLFVVDHKNHKELPDIDFQLLDSQSALYLWALLKKKYGVEGFIWNYLVTRAPSKPRAVKNGSRLYSKLGPTDYLTFSREIRRLLDSGELLKLTPEIKATAARLKAIRYDPSNPGISPSPFFRRDVLRKSSEQLNQVARENYLTVKRLQEYPFNKRNNVERSADYNCKWCGYRDLCTVELIGGNDRYLRKNNFEVGDPMAYYKDREDKDA